MSLLKPRKQMIYNIAMSNYCATNMMCFNCKLFVDVYDIDLQVTKMCLFAYCSGTLFLPVSAIPDILKEFSLFSKFVNCDLKCDNCKRKDVIKYGPDSTPEIASCAYIPGWIYEVVRACHRCYL